MKKLLSTLAGFGIKLIGNPVIRKRLIVAVVGSGVAIGGVNLAPETVEQIVTVGLSVWASM